MRHLHCFVCLLVLLAGCSEPPSAPPVWHCDHQHSIHGFDKNGLAIEGVTYNYSGIYGLKEGEWVYSLVVVFPDSDKHYVPVIRSTKEEIKGHIYLAEEGNTTITKWVLGDARPAGMKTKIADVSFDYVYFIDDEKIVFQKSLEELGVDRSNPKEAFESKRLKSILETMLRENVPPPEVPTP